MLVASEPLHWSAWEKFLGPLSLPYNEQEIRGLVGRTAPEILHVLLDRHQPGWETRGLDLNALALAKNDIYLEIARSRLGAYPGVAEGLDWLRAQGIRTAVVSNARRREVESAVTIAGIHARLDLIVSRDDVPTPKPDPGMYLLAAASLGAEPGDCLAIEDSPPGLEAALMGRIPTAAVTTNFSRSEVEAPVPGRPDLRPVWVGESMLEFFAWVRSLAPR